MISRAAPNTRLAPTRLDRLPEGGVEVCLYRANWKWVLQSVVY